MVKKGILEPPFDQDPESLKKNANNQSLDNLPETNTQILTPLKRDFSQN